MSVFFHVSFRALCGCKSLPSSARSPLLARALEAERRVQRGRSGSYDSGREKRETRQAYASTAMTRFELTFSFLGQRRPYCDPGTSPVSQLMGVDFLAAGA